MDSARNVVGTAAGDEEASGVVFVRANKSCGILTTKTYGCKMFMEAAEARCEEHTIRSTC